MNNCKKCNHTCHCGLSAGCQCDCVSCVCKKSIHELAKANPNKAYKVLEQERAEQATYEHNGGMVKPLNKRKEKYV